MKLKGIKSRST